MTDTVIHLHREDCPRTLDLLRTIVGDGSPGGWEPTEAGAFVDWEALTSSYLSTTEKAAVHIARGCWIIERHGGGLPGRLRAAVAETIEAMS